MLSRGKFSANRLQGGRRWTGTVAGDRGNKALDTDTVRLLKTQDVGYLRTMRNVVAKEVKDLEQKAVIAGAFAGVDVNEEAEEEDEDSASEEDEAPRSSGAKSKPKKIVFADSAEEREKITPRQGDNGDDDNDMDMDNASEKSDDEKGTAETQREQTAERLRRKLQTARKKLKALTDAENELEMQRARMAKTATVGGITKNGKKIKVRERKR